MSFIRVKGLDLAGSPIKLLPDDSHPLSVCRGSSMYFSGTIAALRESACGVFLNGIEWRNGQVKLQDERVSYPLEEQAIDVTYAAF